MYQAVVYDNIIQSKTLRGIKMQASKIANGRFNSIDTMELVISKGYALANPVKFTRINKKCPNNTIEYGKWN